MASSRRGHQRSWKFAGAMAPQPFQDPRGQRAADRSEAVPARDIAEGRPGAGRRQSTKPANARARSRPTPDHEANRHHEANRPRTTKPTDARRRTPGPAQRNPTRQARHATGTGAGCPRASGHGVCHARTWQGAGIVMEAAAARSSHPVPAGAAVRTPTDMGPRIRSSGRPARAPTHSERTAQLTSTCTDRGGNERLSRSAHPQRQATPQPTSTRTDRGGNERASRPTPHSDKQRPSQPAHAPTAAGTNAPADQRPHRPLS
jgi:hypothetical protein